MHTITIPEFGKCVTVKEAQVQLGVNSRQAISQAIGRKRLRVVAAEAFSGGPTIAWIPLSDIKKYKREFAGKPGRKATKRKNGAASRATK